MASSRQRIECGNRDARSRRSASTGQRIQGAGRAAGRDLEHMRVDHRGADVAVAQQFLHRADVGACLQYPEFVRRFLQHVLPTGLKRIRHYGVLASACKGEKPARARDALAMPAPNPPALESATDFLRRVSSIEAAQCPHCKVGTLRVVEVLAGWARLSAPPGAAPRASCRGPP